MGSIRLVSVNTLYNHRKFIVMFRRYAARFKGCYKAVIVSTCHFHFHFSSFYVEPSLLRLLTVDLTFARTWIYIILIICKCLGLVDSI